MNRSILRDGAHPAARRAAVGMVLLVLFAACALGAEPEAKNAPYAKTPRRYTPFGRFVEPYKKFFLEEVGYYGPGRETPEPQGLKSVKIGFIGPIEQTVSVATGGASHGEVLGRAMLRGSRLAVEEANARGGYRGKTPYELVVTNDNGLWGSSGNEIVKFAYIDKVWGILGTIDGGNSHIAIRVALKAELPIINTADTDPTFVETNIPWAFRCIGDDRQMAYLIADYLFEKKKYTRVAAIRASNRYGRVNFDEVRDNCTRAGRALLAEMQYQVGDTDFGVQLRRIRSLEPEVVVTWGDAKETALILKQMRAMGMKQLLVASDRAVCDEFLKIAGPAAEGAMAGYPWDPTRRDPKLEKFRRTFRKRFDGDAETYAAHAYDGMNILIGAIEKAGLNRAKIRDAMAALKLYDGVTGPIPFDAVHQDVGDVTLARVENGKWSFHTRKQLELAAAGEVRIGWFGPTESDDPIARGLWRGVTLAVERVNRAGGCRSRPVRLVSRWADDPWGAASRQMANLVYRDRVCAVLGSIDGAGSHVAAQLATKARVPLVVPACTDPSLTRANVPWVFRCAPDDTQQSHVLAETLAELQPRGVVLVSGIDHDSRVGAESFQKEILRRAGIVPRLRLSVQPAQRDFAPLLERLEAADADTVVVWAPPDVSARFIRELRRAGSRKRVVGPGWLLSDAFLRPAGSAADGIRTVALWDPPAGEPTSPFVEAYTARFGDRPDYAGAYAYDAANLLLEAVRRGGTNRARIREALAGLSGYVGVTGEYNWDNGGGNVREIQATVARAAIQ